MKLSISILIPLIALAAIFIGGYYLNVTFEPPEAKLNQQIDEQVERAQRLLYQYNAAAPQLDRAFTAAATQPENIEPDAWQRHVAQSEEGSPFASLKQRSSQQERQLRTLSQQIAGASGGQVARPRTAGPTQAYQAMLGQAETGHAMLDEALRAVRDAVNASEGQASGRNHPAATRLEAVLLQHKADLLRREAAIVRAEAGRHQAQFARSMRLCQGLDQEIRNQQAMLAGGTAPGKQLRPAVQLEEEPAAVEANNTPSGESMGEQQADEPTTPGFWGQLTGAARTLKQKADQPEPAAPETMEAEAPGEPPAPVAEVPAEPEFAPDEQVPSLARRIADLQRKRSASEAKLSEGQALVEQLKSQVDALQSRVADAQAKARKAEAAMIEAERGGLDVEEYNRLAETFRQASREAALLLEGGVRNARSSNDDPDEIQDAPLVPADPAEPMRPERGLAVLQADLAEAEAVVDAGKQVLAEIDRQLKELNARSETIAARIDRLRQDRQQCLEQAEESTDAAMVAAIRADALEAEAIELAEGRGAQAAQRAVSAASDFQRKMQAFVRSENPTEMPDRELTDMAASQTVVAHARLAQGDIDYVAARTHAQKATGVEQHGKLLERMKSVGMSVALPEPLPEGIQADAVPDYVTSEEKAAEVVKEERQAAAQAAKTALDQYSQAAGQLKDLWVAHASVAAAHNLLADLPKTEGDTEDHALLARQTYNRAIQGREARPEYSTYRRIADSLREATRN